MNNIYRKVKMNRKLLILFSMMLFTIPHLANSIEIEKITKNDKFSPSRSEITLGKSSELYVTVYLKRKRTKAYGILTGKRRNLKRAFKHIFGSVKVARHYLFVAPNASSMLRKEIFEALEYIGVKKIHMMSNRPTSHEKVRLKGSKRTGSHESTNLGDKITAVHLGVNPRFSCAKQTYAIYRNTKLPGASMNFILNPNIVNLKDRSPYPYNLHIVTYYGFVGKKMRM